MTTKNQQNKQNNPPNKQDSCIVCSGLTLFKAYVDGKLLPCHDHCLVVLRQRDQHLETAVVASVV